ncbi:hypothetical protein MG9_05299, partial [Candida albicans P37037]
MVQPESKALITNENPNKDHY